MGKIQNSRRLGGASSSHFEKVQKIILTAIIFLLASFSVIPLGAASDEKSVEIEFNSWKILSSGPYFNCYQAKATGVGLAMDDKSRTYGTQIDTDCGLNQSRMLLRLFAGECQIGNETFCIESLSVVDSRGQIRDLTLSPLTNATVAGVPSRSIPLSGYGVLATDNLSGRNFAILANGMFSGAEVTKYVYALDHAENETWTLAGFDIELVPLVSASPFDSYAPCASQTIDAIAVQGRDNTFRCYGVGSFGTTPDEVKFSVQLRLPISAKGWWTGSVKDPSIRQKINPDFQLVKIDAAPLDVGNAKGSVPVSVALRAGMPGSPNPVLRWFTDSGAGNDFFLLRVLQMGGYEKAPRSVLRWSAKLGLERQELSTETFFKYKACAQNFLGYSGYVFSNALAYTSGPPDFVDGFFDYSVADFHLNPQGQVAVGRYEMVVSKAFARCLYGYSNAPVSATLSVLDVDGEEKVATTMVSERDGWLKLTAHGFTYSENKIRAKITQPFTKILTKFPGSTTVLSSRQKAEVASTLARAKANPMFVCTGNYLNPSSRKAALARAKSVCEFAKSREKELLYFVYASQTIAKGLDSKVTITSK